MVMLSELLRYRVMDAGGESTQLTDLAIGQLDTDYPLVTYLVFRERQRGERIMRWDQVEAIERTHRQIKIKSYGQAETIDHLGQAVRLQRDVLDALILDLQNRRATRANDLWLAEENGQLRLSAADTSARAILRRLAPGLYRGIDRSALYDWKYIEFLRGDPQAVRVGAGYHGRIGRLPPGDIASLAASIPYLHAAELLELLPEQVAADTLELMAPERQLQVFEELNEKHALHILRHMAPDMAADIVGRMNTEVARRYLNQLPRRSGERIVELLQYPDNTVGGIMCNDMVTVPANVTIKEARQSLRAKLKEPDFVHFVYAVEEKPPHKLRGVITLRQFFLAEDDQTIEEIMNPYVITLSPMDPAASAAYRVLTSQLAALPVLGREGQLLGTVTIDAAVSQVAPRSWRSQAPRVFS